MPPVADTFRTVTLAEIDVTIEQAIGDAKMLGAICFLSVKTGETNVMRGGGGLLLLPSPFLLAAPQHDVPDVLYPLHYQSVQCLVATGC
ncbi:hypothetical protein Pla52o_06080 [Novipirellula galeiformis]|uniref:Uncharacterized protein n=1 Tax=Novipirellula galeiformis TaxID=2528004 RepID=A0A5C6CT28_9BACT|nr:hypothetical protein Pla52o_06080 [Novipirellula galeiformis]